MNIASHASALRLNVLALVAVVSLAAAAAPAQVETLIDDSFDGAGIVNNELWRITFADPDGGSDFLGRTLLKSDFTTDFPNQGIASPAASDGLVTVIELDTFNPVPGNAGVNFHGQELLTRRNYARGGGLSFQARVRLQPPTSGSLPGGLVGGVFLYDTVAGADPAIRDEIDHELLSNETLGGTPNRVYTNVYNDVGFPGAGNPQFINGGTLPAGFDLTQFHDYRIDWETDRVNWFVDGQLVRTETTDVPNDTMRPRMNIWVPDSGFADAYDASLQPDSTANDNREFRLEIDSVQLLRKNTVRGENLLDDPSFENDPITVNNDTNLGPGNGWFGFNNVSIVSGDSGNGFDFPTDPDDPASTKVIKAYGPFSGESNASGFRQQITVTPGLTYEASLKALTSTQIAGAFGTGDSIAGMDNYVELQLFYLDSAGAVIAEYSSPLIDGRDPNAIEDRYVEAVIDSIAPANAVTAELRGLFVQLCDLNAFPPDLCDGGSVLFDSASFRELTIAALIPGDADVDGDVDGDDFNAWGGNFPTASGATLAQGDFDGDGDVDGDDFNIWGGNFPYPGPSASAVSEVPEPGSLVLLGLGAAAMVRRRRRGGGRG